MEAKAEEIRKKLPKIVTNLVMALIFWLISIYVPPTFEGVIIPGINVDASLLVWILSTVVMAIFLIRAAANALVIGDILTDKFVKKLGVADERSLKTAAREVVYIIAVILFITAVSPLLSAVEGIGSYLVIAATYAGLGLIIILVYDIGRTLYGVIEQKAGSLADRMVQNGEKKPK